MKQHLLKFFAFILCIFVINTVSAQMTGTITVKYEQEGAGEPEIEYVKLVSGQWQKTIMNLTPGDLILEDAIYSWKSSVQRQAYELYIRPNAKKKLLSVLINGEENPEYLKAGVDGNQFIHAILESGDQTVSIKLIYEGEYVEKQWTQKLNSTISWGGTVKCTYEDKTKGEQTVVVDIQKPMELDVKPDEEGKYKMRIIAEPESGKVLKFITVNNVDVKKSYDANGYYDIVVETEKATSNLIVEFGDAPRADMIVRYSFGGDGTTDYYYFSDAESADKKEGSFVVGENLFNEMYFSDKYVLYVVPKPAEGSLIGDIKINGVADSSKKEQFEANGYFTIEETVPGEETWLLITYVSEAQKKNVVTIKANPDVDYVIRYSNISEQKQEIYEIKREDVIIELPDNSFCSWTYTNNPGFVVKGLKINGSSMIDPSFYVNSDVTIELDYIPTAQFTVSLNKYSNGEVFLEKRVFGEKDWTYVSMEEGEKLVAGTVVRISAYADPGYEIKTFKVNGELKMESTSENSEYEYIYTEELWEDLNIEVDFALMSTGIDNVENEPVVMEVYSIDGVLIKKCVATTVEEAVEGLSNGLYIVNGNKVVVSKSAR